MEGADLKDVDGGDVELCSANIQIGDDGVNRVGEDHEFTVTVNQILAGTETRAEGVDVAISYPDGAPSATALTSCDAAF